MRVRFSARSLALAAATAATLTVVQAGAARAQSGDFHWSKALPAGDHVSVGNINGDVTVRPSTSGKVEVTGITRERGDANLHAVVNETSSGVRICVLIDNDDRCDDQNEHGDFGRHDRSWRGRVDLEVAVPATLSVSAGDVSGDVSVTGAQGDVEASSVSGDLHLDHLRAISLRANSVSGDIRVSIDALSGDGPLSFHTVSGDVVAELPRDLNADFSMSTVSGSLNTDFPVTLDGRWSRRSTEGRIGKGGRRLEFASVSGDLTLRATK
jgi:hypothetical protein